MNVTYEHQITEWFRQNRESRICDDCLRKHLQFDDRHRSMISNVTRVLGTVPELFAREDASCGACGIRKRVTWIHDFSPSVTMPVSLG